MKNALEAVQRLRNRGFAEKTASRVATKASGRPSSTHETYHAPGPHNASTEAKLTLVELTLAEREAFKERAAIMEHEAKLPRGQAEELALVGIINQQKRNETEP